jgi:OOP family OmpA-OmpF porin
VNKVLGGLVMIAGVAGLGIWGANDHAERMQTKITAAAAQVADRSVHGVVTTVNGRDIRVSGLADGPGEHDALLAALHDIEGRRVVVGDLKVLTVQQPFTFAARKAENGISLSGYVPTEKARAELGAAADSLTLAAGAPEGWTGAAATSVAALDTVIEGEISLSDAEASYAGLVRTPAERDVALEVLAGLPEGYSASGQFEMQDDGTPPAFHLL